MNNLSGGRSRLRSLQVLLCIAFIGICGALSASTGACWYLKCEFETTDGAKITGYYETCSYGVFKAPALAGFVAAPSGVNLRDAPSAKGKAVKKLPDATPLAVLSRDGDQVEIEGKKAPWFKVKAGDLEGYVFGGFVQIASPDEGGTTAAEAWTFAEMDGDGSMREEPVNGEFFLKKFVREADGAGSEASQTGIGVFREIHELRYKPELGQNVMCDQIERNSFMGALDTDFVEIEKSKLKSVRVLDVREGGIAPLLVLKKDELERLGKPAKALFSVENDPEGVVALVSYSNDYSTPQRLEALLKGFAESRKTAEIPADAGWWYPIYEKGAEQEFRQTVLPKDVVLLTYHVQD
ncbi:MAG TPA: SH3 domain-containing protein [Candidatus Ozemobacteraceae bacterium]|nr:SH3 domain-containing protein [Candidatus Ozemobacteraceae bacterium]HQG28691.1 SH3 domain-containing protein [Candidatus Ozemobacteraceae bacterium]